MEFWREASEGGSGGLWESLITAKVKRETKRLLPKGGKLRAIVRRADTFKGRSAFFGGVGDDKTLSVTLPDTYESWNVAAADVRVACVPKDSDVVKQYFPWLPEIDWDPE